MVAKPRFGIRSQILLIAVIPIAIITMIQIALIYRSNIIQGQIALDRQGQLLAAQLAANLEYALFAGAADQMSATVTAVITPSAVVMDMPISRVTIFDREQKVIFSLEKPPSESTDELHPLVTWMVPMDTVERFQASVFLDPLDMADSDDGNRRLLGDVHLEVQTFPIRRALLTGFLWELGLVIITLSLALGLAAWLGWRLLTAIREISDAVLRIKQGDFRIRFKPIASAELSTVQEGITLAAEAISQGQQRLQQALSAVQTQHEKALSQLSMQTQAAEQANAAKGMFLAKVSHEMRTPLYSILGHSERLQASKLKGDDKHAVDKILAAVRTLEYTISDILDFTHLERNGYQPIRKPFDPWVELEAIMDTIEVMALQQALYVDIIVNKDVAPHVIGDAKAFHVIVNNLLSNALKFTSHGGICLRLETDTESIPPGIVLTVMDTGCGIPQHKHVEIFQPFEQLDDGLNRHYEGSGLGLSIVRGLCESMGGYIKIDSEPGRGSLFKVRLPFAPDPTAKEPRSDRFFDLRALVIGERATFCQSVSCRLGSLGIKVTVELIHAVQLLAMPTPAQPFDWLVVQDVDLDDMLLTLSSPIRRQWTKHILCLETAPLASPQYDNGFDGITRIWCGATRNAIAVTLETVDDARDTDARLHDENNLRRCEEFLQGKQVLVVEDFDVNRDIMTYQLRRHGLNTLEADNGNDAVRLAQQQPVDLILMDIQMPGKDGISAIREIRQSYTNDNLPIIGFTASADKLTHQLTLAAGADRVLTKPIGEVDLVVAIYQAMTEPSVCG